MSFFFFFLYLWVWQARAVPAGWRVSRPVLFLDILKVHPRVIRSHLSPETAMSHQGSLLPVLAAWSLCYFYKYGHQSFATKSQNQTEIFEKKKKNLEDSLYMYCVWPERHIVLYYTFNKMLLSCTVVVQEGRFRPLMAAAAINASSHRHGHLVYKDLVWTASLSCLLLPKCCPTL